jgi:hypothetical protein
MLDAVGNTKASQVPLLAPSSPRGATQLACLNFKVPLQIRQQFKICAARQNMTMTELLLRLLDDFLQSATRPDGQRSQDEK